MYKNITECLYEILRRYTDVCHAHVNMIIVLFYVLGRCGHFGYSGQVASSVGHGGARAALCVWPWFYSASWSLKCPDGHG